MLQFLNPAPSFFPKPKSPNTFCTYVIRPMSRQKLTLRLNADVIKQAKELGMNLSGFMEIRLREYFTLLNQEIVTPRRRFELGFTSKKFTFSPIDY